MNEPNDKPFHDWVRQTLHSYRPGYDAPDWATLQRTLRRRRWWRRGAVGVLGLSFIVLVGWLLVPQTESVRKPLFILPAPAPARIANKPTLVPIQSVPASHSSKQKIRRPKAIPTPQDHAVPEPISSLPTHTQLSPLSTNLTAAIRLNTPVAFSSEETAIRQQMVTGDFGPDSTSYQTLSRNLRRWPDAVIVCDLTSSMYPYSTQLFAWFRQNVRNPTVQGIVFFTDCDSLGQQTRPGGPAGQMFISREREATSVLPTMIRRRSAAVRAANVSASQTLYSAGR